MIDGERVPPILASPALLWSGVDLRTVVIESGPPPTRAVEGRCVRVEVAIAPGLHRVRVDCDSGATDRFDLIGPSGILARGWSPRAPWSGDVMVPDSVLALFVAPRVGGRVRVRSVRIERADGAEIELGKVTRGAAEALVAGFDPPGADAPREYLRAVCEYLVRHQLSTGFFDYESSAWWEVGLSARVLLLGAKLLGEGGEGGDGGEGRDGGKGDRGLAHGRADPRYLMAALRPLDFLVSRQEADGGLCAYAYSVTTGAGSDPSRAFTARCHTRNVADLSVAFAALSIAAPLLPDSTATRYLAAHRRFLDHFAARHRLADGSFRNGLFSGRDGESSYSVATGAQVFSLVAFYRASGESEYLRRAEEAGRWLLQERTPWGEILFHPHDGGVVMTLPSTQFHDAYYILEGLACLRRATGDASLRDEIGAAFRAYVEGPEGLLAAMPEGAWPEYHGERRLSAKSNAMVGLLLEMTRAVREPEHEPERGRLSDSQRVERLIANGMAALLDPARAREREILVLPYRGGGREAIVATSFAGLSYAQMVRAGAAYE